MNPPALFPHTQYDLVVLAAAAGGLPAVIQVVSRMPVSFPAAVIFIQPRSPRELSQLSDILSRKTAMEVKEAQDQEEIHPGCLYITVPDQHLKVYAGGVLQLSRTQPLNIQGPSIDLLLESAAKVCQKRLVAVLLSGMGSDGVLGCQAVKRNGGVVIAENPNEALFSAMPGETLQTGMVDAVLSVDQIPSYIIQLIRVDKAGVP